MMVKSLKTLALEKLTIKCKQNQFGYDKLNDLNLMEYCFDAILL